MVAIKYLKDYQVPLYGIDSVDLLFDLQEDKTRVQATLQGRLNGTGQAEHPPLVLYGEKLILESLILDGRKLSPGEYQIDQEQGTLTLAQVPEKFKLEITTEIHPEQNTELSGLFRSKAIFCTQCESQGFRRITYYPDRPDVMAKFSTTIYADKKRYPVLLSNGNCVGRGTVDPIRHWIRWEDPFSKPSYLFALVAGDLVSLEDYFITCSGRLVTLKIYVERDNQDKCQHAMAALKKSMAWDEATYGREYDLDIYMIVAVNDFNMGAMENKGLNIFNSKYILARPETATDTDYQNIDAVVGHEYFHNWSGNRVTCRDWFQLSLKEGLTVFREHHFSQDISQSPVQLIENVRQLRSSQFPEDSGPMAHSVRPESYLEINNFYTTTIYEKGAELIRMLKTLLGWESFRRGMDLYFERHDGQAVTTDDFVAALQAVSTQDLSQFRLWYSQAGTPEITLQESYVESSQSYQITLRQFCPPTPEQPLKLPMLIPFAIGLLDQTGKDILEKTEVLVLTKAEQSFSFPKMPHRPIVSVLRGFSAPVRVKFDRSEETLAFLLAQDSDPFSRWEAGQQLSEKILWRLVEDYTAQRPLIAPALWLDAQANILQSKTLNPAFKAELLTFPALSYLLELRKPADIDAIYALRTFLKQQWAEYVNQPLLEQYQALLSPEPYRYSSADVAKRSLKNLCLQYLLLAVDPAGLELCMAQWKNANNMTDALGVLAALSHWEGPERAEVLAQFYTQWQHDPLVIDKWFRVQALSELPNTLDTVKKLMQHPDFSISNPNRVYALIGAFSSGNLRCFHDKSGAGYSFLADTVLQLDKLNPQVASRMVRAFSSWQRFDLARQAKMKTQLVRLQDSSGLSRDVFEIVSKCLTSPA